MPNTWLERLKAKAAVSQLPTVSFRIQAKTPVDSQCRDPESMVSSTKSTKRSLKFTEVGGRCGQHHDMAREKSDVEMNE